MLNVFIVCSQTYLKCEYQNLYIKKFNKKRLNITKIGVCDETRILRPNDLSLTSSKCN